MYKLSKPQESIFEMSRFSNDNITNVAGDIFFDFPVSVEAARDTAVNYFKICDTFHTRIVMVDGIPMQKIVHKEIYPDDIIVREFETYHDYENWAKADALKPIDIFGCLYRLSIIKIGDKVGFYCVTHHIINDATSFNIMAKYACEYLRGNKDQYFCSYNEYLDSEEKYEQGLRYKKDKDYWLNIYNNGEVNLLFETNGINRKSSRKSYYISDSLSTEIKKFCEDNEISEYTLFLTAISLYYSRITQKNIFFIGSPILNRNNLKENKTMGVFINTVPIGFSFEEDESFADMCAHTSDNILSAFRHQKYHYTQLLKDVNELYGTSKRMFDVVVSFLNTKTSDGAEIGWFSTGSQLESLQIHIDDRKNKGYYRILYDYQTEKFTESDIERFHNNICTLILEAVENQDKKLCELEILAPVEKNKALNIFNNTTVDYPRDKCIHELFESQVEKTPEKTAVVAVDKTLTYRELNEEANKIAHSLIEKGIGKGDIVGLMLPRRSYLLSALLGILKTGAAYLPIDPDYPKDRIEYMLEDSCAKYCITEEKIYELLSNKNIENPDVTVNSEDICYCIYTSGSTGKPKGTLLTHRNVVNYIGKNEHNILGNIIKDEHRNILSVTTVGFDIFVTESLLPLANGLTVILANEEEAKIQSKLNSLIKKHPVDVMQTTPTKMRALIKDKSNLDYLEKLKAIILGGEALDKSLVADLKKITDIRIYNIYGPTETTVWSTYTEVTDSEDIHIGKPIANTQIYITDKYMNPVPVGVTGELCIAGDGVCAGYLNNADLTEEKFIDNPFGDGKLYKTGDLAYWREDGNICYVGRNDFQVKIRGQRIELGEIENAISSVDGVVQSAVVVRKDKEARQFICAFYTGTEIDSKTLRTILSSSLPKYMVPHIFTHIEEMPLTSSGKINRKALPETDLNNISTETEYVAPETAEEKALAEAIKEVLDCEEVSTLDNFFDMGGDSLKSIELISELEDKGYEVEIKVIFESLNIQDLAKQLTVKTTTEETIEYDSVIPATAAQMRVYTSQFMKPDSAHYNMPSAFKVEDLDTERLEKAVNELIARHESLRTHFENRDGQIMQVINDTARITVEKLESDDISVFNTPFDLTKAPLLRVGYYENTVMVVIHHIIADGESMPVFFKELNDLYMDRELTEKTVQYGEFAVSDKYTEENEKYWLKLFSDEITSLELPTDFQRPEKQSFNGTAVYDLIDISLHNKITEKCKKLNITPYVFYMTCYNILLSKLSNNEDICVGTPISGRSAHFLNTVGMFVNTSVLRSNTDGNKTIETLMQEIREQSISAIDNQNYPFGELIKKLNISSISRNPIFDVMFTYQSEQLTSITFGDKEAEALPVSLGGVKCDFNFNILPRKDDVVLIAEYCTDLYKEETIKKFITSFKLILNECLDETKLIKDISAMDEEEKNTILYDFNNTEYTYSIPDNSTLYSLFEEASEKKRDKVCIKANDEEITFADFKEYAERIDSKVREITDSEKSVIAVICERSFEMYGAIYGIIRGGNAYLPIDPNYPQDRIDYILENSNAKAVITQSKFKHLAGNTACIDATELLKEKELTEKTECLATPDDTAYVIYTSGSTGNPKGAKISHKSAINRILWMHDFYPLEDNDVILQKTSYTFDVSVWELFWWGMTGKTLCASKPDEHFLPAKILYETEKNKVTHLHFVPSVFDIFITYLENNPNEREKFNTVKYVFLSGEALSANHIKRFYNLYDYNKVQLHNLYGPTECAVDVSYYACVPTDTDPVPIGKPIYNTQLYIVDKHLNPTPIGVVGELCIGGVNVGQGYLNNADLTEEKFIDNPFGEGKLYKTGDLAYWREDGNICYVGRIDSQVKLNGQRIELGEIETVISNIDGVEAATVITRKVNERDILVAFYCGENSDEEAIRNGCYDVLPSYMIPSVIVRLEKMPLNPSGKLDRKALASFEIIEVEENIYEAPLNKNEEIICEIFKRILGIEAVGRNSDFFDMGGTSLSMISLLSEDEFKSISAADFIANPTPAKLAKLFNNGKNIETEYLELLYSAPTEEKSIVLFPFAGGGAEAYANFVDSMKNADNSISIYFVRYLHSAKECRNAAEEIEKILGGEKIYFYSHCVGSAVALQILNILETKNCTVEHYIAGGSIPAKKPSKRNGWNITPNFILRSKLIKAGAPLDKLAKNDVTAMLKDFRCDTDFATQYYYESHKKIRTPLSLVINKNDPFTTNYKEAEWIWQNHCENLKTLNYIESSTHYFQSDDSDELVKIILEAIK